MGQSLHNYQGFRANRVQLGRCEEEVCEIDVKVGMAFGLLTIR